MIVKNLDYSPSFLQKKKKILRTSPDQFSKGKKAHDFLSELHNCALFTFHNSKTIWEQIKSIKIAPHQGSLW